MKLKYEAKPISGVIYYHDVRVCSKIMTMLISIEDLDNPFK